MQLASSCCTPLNPILPGCSRPALPTVRWHVQVVYETLPGWKQDISKVRLWDDLPEKARR
jgi:adenylosuccinate synthase